jgi:hypothetical protein
VIEDHPVKSAVAARQRDFAGGLIPEADYADIPSAAFGGVVEDAGEYVESVAASSPEGDQDAEGTFCFLYNGWLLG